MDVGRGGRKASGEREEGGERKIETHTHTHTDKERVWKEKNYWAHTINILNLRKEAVRLTIQNPVKNKVQ